MPTYDFYDVFCFSSGDVAVGASYNFADATLVDPMPVDAGTLYGYPRIFFQGDPTPSMLGGSPATFLGSYQMQAVMSDGSTQIVGGNYIETADGSTYMMFNDSAGDFEIVSGDITGIGQPREPILTAGYSDNNVTNAPCFTRGMQIRTDKGQVAIEDLTPGDQVWTLDNGFQTVKHISHRSVAATGSNVPVLMEKGAIGNTADILVSQKHRFHIASLRPEIRDHFAPHDDTLLQAVAFCNGTTVRLYPDKKTVEYFHLMFDNHELIECHGTVSESWQPTHKALKHNPDQAAELLSIFPELTSRTAQDPGSVVRTELVLKSKASQ